MKARSFDEKLAMKDHPNKCSPFLISKAIVWKPRFSPSDSEKGANRPTGITKAVPLLSKFKVGEWLFQQIDRRGNVCLYLKQCKGVSGRAILSWEVVLPNIRKAQQYPSGRSYPLRETYPKDGEWGIRGFTYMSEAEARIAFELRCAEQATPGEATSPPTTGQPCNTEGPL
jgi:hypothetical protein